MNTRTWRAEDATTRRANGNGGKLPGRCRTDGRRSDAPRARAAFAGKAAQDSKPPVSVDRVTVTCHGEDVLMRLDREAAEMHAGDATKLSVMLREAAVEAVKAEQIWWTRETE